MKKGHAKKLLAAIMALVMLLSSALTVNAASAGTTSQGSEEEGSALKEIKETLNLIKYENYLLKYEYDEKAEVKPESVTVQAKDYDKDATTAPVEEKNILDKDCIVVGDTGSVSWKFDIPEEGFYTISFDYCPTTDVKTDIERVLKVNGATPYDESRYIALNKTWKYTYTGSDRDTAFPEDHLGNELIPEFTRIDEWDTYTLHDFYGHYINDLLVHFKAGDNTITLENVRDEVAISEITVHTPDDIPTYAELLEDYNSKGYKPAAGGEIYMEAEMPDCVSASFIYPINDHSSSVTSPQDAATIKKNVIGGNKWVDSGKWIRYSFECTESGLYEIVTRFRQDELSGVYTSRSLKINGEYPFDEAKRLRFDYNSDWQTGKLTDGNDEFSFYFEAGKTYTLEFEVTLGNMSDVVLMADNIVENLNKDFMNILKITGNDPDVNIDYAFGRIMPEVITDLGYQANLLYAVIEYLTEMNGVVSSNSSELEQSAILIEKMASDESEIAANLANLKDSISSLSSWVSNICSQYLELDYIQIQPAGGELPRAKDNFLQAMMFELKKFAVSFVADYNSFSDEGKEGKTITAWTSSGRDQAQITKNLTNDGFTAETGINVDIKLVAGGTLLPSILAGVGPDVSLDPTSPVEMAMRGAILPLDSFGTFDEVCSRFSEKAILPMRLYGNTYGIPVSQVIPLMFCRNDVLEQLDIEVPKTWDDLLAAIPVLQFNNMDIGLHRDYTIYLYQNGGSYWKDEGMTTTLDSAVALDSFEYMCNMFTQYTLAIQFDPTTRFKTGEMPIMFADYAMYNTLAVYAPEISGLWQFYEIPGVLDPETGEINNTNRSYVSGIIMPRGCRETEASWQYIDWYSDKDYQVDYSNEMTALLGPSAKQSVANLDAFDELPWTKAEAEVIKSSLEKSFTIQNYPGDYFIERYTGFSFNSAYNQGSDPSDSLLSYISSINKELTRKRREFHMMVEPEWQAIKDYTGFEEFSQWREFWAELRGTSTKDNSCIQAPDDGSYSFSDWMKENNVSEESNQKWMLESKRGETTLSYKEWLGQ